MWVMDLEMCVWVGDMSGWVGVCGWMEDVCVGSEGDCSWGMCGWVRDVWIDVCVGEGCVFGMCVGVVLCGRVAGCG